MRVLLDRRYLIETDKRSFRLVRYQTVDGEIKRGETWYYAELKSAIRKYVDLKIKRAPDVGVDRVLKRLDLIDRKIEKFFVSLETRRNEYFECRAALEK